MRLGLRPFLLPNIGQFKGYCRMHADGPVSVYKCMNILILNQVHCIKFREAMKFMLLIAFIYQASQRAIELQQ